MSHTEKHAAVTPSCSSTLPSPCAVFPPLHPDCSQTQPQWRLCWGRVVDCSASPLALQSDIQENCSPPQNNGPKGYRDKSNGDKVILCVYIYKFTALFAKNKGMLQQKGKQKCWCVIGSNNVCPHQFNKTDQAVIEGSDSGAVLEKLVQTLLVECLGSCKV